jgi:hypothetical protein
VTVGVIKILMIMMMYDEDDFNVNVYDEFNDNDDKLSLLY